MSRFFEKLKRKLVHLRLRPIRVFCFHQVGDEFKPETMWECDWMQTETFKKVVLSMMERYRFISIQEAYNHIANDKFRLKHYAVLTADDGWASLLNVLPWLSEQAIPVVLFLNPGYFDGMHFRERKTERYLLEKDIKRISDAYNNVSFGMHGWEHVDVSLQSEDEFRKNVERSVQTMKNYKIFAPFFAYTWGRHTSMTDSVLLEYGLTPVLMDGMKNYSDAFFVHRELLVK